LTAYTGTQSEVIFANGFAYPAANAASASAQSLITGASGKYQQPVFYGGFWQEGRSNQVSTADFVISITGQASATTAIITAGLNTAPNNITGSTLVASSAITVTSFSSASFIGRLLISNFGSGYGTSSVSTNLQSSMNLVYTNSATNGTNAAGPTALQTIDFSVNQWLYLTVTFSTSSATNSATLQQFMVSGLN
jgi:hypothetical protein